jgi:hypothetical protein
LERIWKEAVVAESKYYPETFLQKIEEKYGSPLA